MSSSASLRIGICAVAVGVLLALLPHCLEAQMQVVTPKFGVVVDTHYNATAYSEVINAHLGWIRLPAYWRTIEITNSGCTVAPNDPSQCHWSQLDQDVNGAVAQGSQVYIGIGYFAPQWANGTQGQTCVMFVSNCAGNPPTNTSYYKNFVTALVNRYKDRVQYYAIWNEPDQSVFWNSTIAKFSTDILVPGAKAVRAASPTAKVIGAEISDSANALGNVLFGTCSYIDFVAVHLFRYNVTNNTNHLQNDYIPAVNQQCGSSKPIWVTAFDFPPDKIPSPSDLTLQAQMLRDQLAALNGIPRVSRIMHYNMVDAASSPKKELKYSHLPGTMASTFARRPDHARR